MASDTPRARGLGQGLALLLRDQRPLEEPPAGVRLVDVEVDRISPNPRQPRGRMDEAALSELVASVRRDGVVQPVIVRPSGDGYELIAGERRWRAAQAAGLAAIPALVRDADDRESLALAVVENVVRADLNPVETARAYGRLVDEFGLSQGEVAEAVGRSRVSVANALRLLDLPDEVLERLETGELSEGHGRAILQAPDHEDRRRLAALAVRRRLSVRETEAQARRLAGGGRPGTRARRGPAWLDDDAVNDLVDGTFRALGVPARVVADPAGCRLEIRLRSPDELAALLARMDAAAAAGGPAAS